ncbi:hypothetical protein, partial [Arthrobacter sp. NPDC092385]|uniref:hypothetical protein n=1 Tax=Arthrobacter sp. NPDC092385 TaxID=3363943 RepID=UPI00380327B0
MRTCVQRGLYGVLLAGGVVVLGAGTATAADLSTGSSGADTSLSAVITAPLQPGTTSGSIIQEAAVALEGSLDLNLGAGNSGLLEGGIANGNLVVPEMVVPVNVSGNSVSLIGDSSSTGESVTTGTTGATTSGIAPAHTDAGILNGNVIGPEAAVPVNVSGNSVSVIGDSSSTGDAGSTGSTVGGSTGGSTGGTTDGGLLNGGILDGNVVSPEVVVPVNVSGNSVSVIGD